VKVALPDGVQWDDSGPFGSGWSCSQIAREVTCSRSLSIPAGSLAPPLNMDLRPSRSNAPEVAVSYLVQTDGDDNSSNNSATRTEEVRYVPETSITSGPPATTESKVASVVFTSDDPTATFECKVDNGAFAACTSPLQLDGLSIGQHSVSVRATNSNAMTDQTPAVVTWTINNRVPSGANKPVKATLTGGSLSLASLGSVPLPADQIALNGLLYESGDFVVPKEGVAFKPVVQNIPDVLGPGTNVAVEISISATGTGAGTLPAGGGPASFVLPVRADVKAKLGAVSVIPDGTECALNPVTFNLTGTYDEAGKTVSLTSPNVGFPQVTGCGGFKGTIDTLLELPRNDISIALDFALADAGCPAGQIGTPPACVPPERTLAKPVVKAPKSVKSGKPVRLRAAIANLGNVAATDVRVCFTAKTRSLVSGKPQVCRTVAAIEPGQSVSSSQRFRTKPGKKGKKVRFEVSAEYLTADGTKKKEFTGHITLLK
jgi:hypothetical protein